MPASLSHKSAKGVPGTSLSCSGGLNFLPLQARDIKPTDDPGLKKHDPHFKPLDKRPDSVDGGPAVTRLRE